MKPGSTAVGVGFPPGPTGVLIPRDDRRCAARGLTLYTASRPSILAAQWMTWMWLRTLGPRLLPGRSEPIDLNLLPEISGALGFGHDGLRRMAIYRRRDLVRTGTTFVASGSHHDVLVKIRGRPDALRVEQSLLSAVSAQALTTFSVPRPLGQGLLADGRYWSAQEMVFSAPHRPCLRLPDGFDDDLARACDHVQELGGRRVHDDLVPAHGDLTPWNLRRDHHGRLWLFDWEDVGFAPPGSDRAYFAAALGVVRPRAPMPATDARSADHWIRRIEDRLEAGHPSEPNSIMLNRLRASRIDPSPGGQRSVGTNS